MEIYVGEYQANNIQDCAPFFKKLIASGLDELNDRNDQTATVRNGQIVETSKGLLWYVTIEFCGAPYPSLTLDDFARSIPSATPEQNAGAYSQEFNDSPQSGLTIAGRITVYCAERTTAFKDPKAQQTTKKGKEFSLAAIAPWNWF